MRHRVGARANEWWQCGARWVHVALRGRPVLRSGSSSPSRLALLGRDRPPAYSDAPVAIVTAADLGLTFE